MVDLQELKDLRDKLGYIIDAINAPYDSRDEEQEARNILKSLKIVELVGYICED